MAYRTTRPLILRAWDHRGMQTGQAPEFTLPAGSAAILVRGLSGTTGDGFAAGSVRQLAELTGNAHDAAHRYVTLPADAIKGETEGERAEIARIIAATGER